MVASEGKQERDELSFADKITGLMTDGGIAVAKTSGMVVGYSGKMLRSIKEGSSTIKVPIVSGKWAKGIFTGGVIKKWGGERASIKINIAKSKEKIDKLYYEIGKRGASLSGVDDINEHDSVKELIDEVKAQEDHIERWETRLNEIDEERKAAKVKKNSRKIDIKGGESEEAVKYGIKGITEKAIRAATFENSSDKVIFDKVTHDLLDDDIEIRILAASELGKMGNVAAVPVLSEALKYQNAYLSSEIINSLININDKSALPVFKDNVNHENYRIRLGCLRGIYKIDGANSVPCLVDALKDEHKEVRKSSATFLGWIGITDSVPALIQAVKDNDQEVKKAAVMALSGLRDPSSVMALIRALADSDIEVREKIVHAVERITGKAVEFKIDSSGDELRENIDVLKEWWQKSKTADVDEVMGDVSDSGAVDEPSDDVSEAETGTEVDVETVKEAPAAEGAEGGAEESAAGDEESKGDGSGQAPPLTEGQLQSILKKDLILKCEEIKIEISSDDTKAVLIQKILEKCGN